MARFLMFPFSTTAFLVYSVATVSLVLALVLHFEPRCGQTNILIYLGICSLMGSLTVMCYFFLYFKLIAKIYRHSVYLDLCLIWL